MSLFVAAYLNWFMRVLVRWFWLGGWLLGWQLSAWGGEGDIAAKATQASRLIVAAASDLKYAMDELVTAFRKHHPAAKVEVVYGSSGKLYEQIVHGAPFDLLFSADIQFPRMLEQKGLTVSGVRPYARGRIVVWSSVLNAARLDLPRLADPQIRRIAIANPDHAPYGQRARQALERAGIWPKVQGKLVFGENVAQAAQFAQPGSAEVGIIALSLASSPSLKAKGSYGLIPEQMHAPLDQGYVILKRAQDLALAQSFAEFLAGEAAQAILQAYGFSLPAGPSFHEP